MSEYHFGDDYDLNYYPPEAYDGMGGVDWDKVERVEIESDVYVKERTCKFVSSRGPDYPPACSACGYELGIYDCEWFEDGTYGYSGNYCPCCGAKVVGSDEAKEV